MYDGSDNLIMRFNYADGRLPVSMLRGGSTYYMMHDQVGSLRLIVDVTGNITKKIDYDSFGNIINDTNLGFTIPFGFAGGLHDRDTGLVRFGARDFDPSIGRWTAKDPIDFAGGDVNLYGYVQNNPVNWVDPLGLRERKHWGQILEAASDIGADAFVSGAGVGAGFKNVSYILAPVFGVGGAFWGGYTEYKRQDGLPETLRFPGEQPEGEPKRQWVIDEENEYKKLLRDFNNLPAPFDDFSTCP